MELVLRMRVVLLKMMELLCMCVSILAMSAASVNVVHARAAGSSVHSFQHRLEPQNVPEIATSC